MFFYLDEHRPYIDANTLANVRRHIMNKKRLAKADIEDIKKTVKKQTKIKKQVRQIIQIKKHRY